MKRRLLLLSPLLLLSAVCALAQYGNQSGSQSSGTSSQTTTTQTTTTHSMDSGQMTVQGCLSQANGSYSLTDNSGTTYQLTGNTARLQAHVGHTIQVTGTTGSASNSSNMSGQAGSMSGSSDMQHTLAVTSFNHVRAGCSTAQ